MGALDIDGLTTRYGAVTALDDIDLQVGDGEFFVVLGPSGAGKTTLLKSVAGLVDIAAGRVRIAGRDMTGVEPYHRNVAMAFESYALYPQKTVYDNLASPLRSGRYETPSAQERTSRIEAVTATLGIGHLLRRLPRELSNGQRQRVALGRVLVRPADVYLLDEPLSHLDAKLRAAMRVELKQLGEMSDTTSLYVTHDYQEALALGDRIAVLREGRIVQTGTPWEIWNTPVDTFVARSLGQPEINLFDAVPDDGLLVAADGALRIPVPAGVTLPGDGRVRIGVRPRDLQVTDPGSPAAQGVSVEKEVSVAGVVVLAERLGRQVELTVDVGGTHAVVVTEHAVAEGANVALRAAPARMHLFGGDDEGRRLDTAPVPVSAATGSDA